MIRPRVLTDPVAHPYIDRLDGPVAQLVHRDVAGLRRHDPDWIDGHSRDWDVVHLHLGLTDTPAEQLITGIEAHRRHGTPVAVTVHDPCSAVAGVSVIELLRDLDRSISAVITLTARCAAVLQQDLDRPVRVIPHGPVLPRPARERLRAHRRLHGGGGPMLLVAGGLPPELAWRDAIEATSRTLTGRRLHIMVDGAHADEVTAAAAGYPQVTVATMQGRTDEAMHRAMAIARSVVLPLRRAGHSWLVELAADIGTPVVATDVGFLADQHPMLTARCDDGRIDVDDMAAAMDAEVSTMVGESDRGADALALQGGYERLYRRLALGRALSRPLTGAGVG